MKITLALVLSALVATAGLVHVPKAAAEIKPVSTAICQRHSKTQFLELNNLQFLAEGVRNVSSSPQYVICPLPKSAKNWDASVFRNVGFYFHRDDASAAPSDAVACSLNTGSGMGGNGMVTKVLVGRRYPNPYTGDYAEVLFNKTTGPNVGFGDALSAICIIPPKYTLEYIHFEEA